VWEDLAGRPAGRDRRRQYYLLWQSPNAASNTKNDGGEREISQQQQQGPEEIFSQIKEGRKERRKVPNDRIHSQQKVKEIKIGRARQKGDDGKE
jgi:hypothetical protein